MCGILADKDAAGVAAQLADCIDAWWLTSTTGARGTSAAALSARVAPHLDAPIHLAGHIGEACAAALAAASRADRIVVFGSFHTVAPAMDWLEGRGLYTPPP